MFLVWCLINGASSWSVVGASSWSVVLTASSLHLCGRQTVVGQYSVWHKTLSYVALLYQNIQIIWLWVLWVCDHYRLTEVLLVESSHQFTYFPSGWHFEGSCRCVIQSVNDVEEAAAAIINNHRTNLIRAWCFIYADFTEGLDNFFVSDDNGLFIFNTWGK